EWDLVFIDANKRCYIDYYEAVMPRLRPGGYIFADNTLWSGKILDAEANHDAQTRGILDFNDYVAKDSRIETVILPIRDGMTILRRK
ncbi:MAG: methyltransferase, partial [Muribaculaceae bacterium]|nr:methyltransferase [Muribaculaceae bacterium]